MNTSPSVSPILHLTGAAFNAEVLDHAEPILIDFWAPWCGPCRAMKPILATAAQELSGKVRVAQVNVDEERELTGLFGIRSIPTCVLMQGEKVLDAYLGVLPTKTLVAKVLNRIAEGVKK